MWIEECIPHPNMWKKDQQVIQNIISCRPLIFCYSGKGCEARKYHCNCLVPLDRPANCHQDYRLHNLRDIQFSFARRKLPSICTTDNVTVKRNKNCMLFLVHGCLTDSVLMPLAISPVRWSKNNKHACPSHSNRFITEMWQNENFHTNASKSRWLILNETSALTQPQRQKQQPFFSS